MTDSITTVEQQVVEVIQEPVSYTFETPANPDSYTFETSPRKGDKGETGIVDVLYGTDDPPDPTGLAEGTIYIKYV